MSRLFAATLMRSSMVSGSRSEMEVVDGFRLGNRTCFALLQSTYSEESCVCQKWRSSASSRKAGIGLGFLVISGPFLAMHIACGNHEDEAAAAAQREGDVQQTTLASAA